MWVLYHTIGVLLLALLVFAVCRVFRPGPAARHALWLVVLIKLLMPPFLPCSIPERMQAVVTETAALPVWDTPSTSPPVIAAPDLQPTTLAESEIQKVEMALSQVDAMPATSPSPLPGNPAPLRWERLRDVAVAVWLCWAMTVGLVQFRRILRLRAGLVQASPASPELVSLVRELSSCVGVRSPRVAVMAGLRSPFIWSGGRTRLLWPQGLEERLSPEGCRSVLVHELAHLARGDHWVGWLLLVAGCVWWWHPLFYLIRRQLLRQAELACDARVVSLLPKARRAYAEALLDVCQLQSGQAAATPLLGIAGRRRDLERRLVMIMRANVPSRLTLRMLAGIGFLSLIALPTWTMGQVDTAKSDKAVASEKDKQLQDLERRLQEVLKDLAAERKATPRPEGKLERVRTDQPLTKVTIGSDDGASHRDKKLQELEAKVQALLKEVQTLRGNKSFQQLQGPKQVEVLQGALFADVDFDGVVDILVTNETTPKSAEVTLSRTTYKLPAAKAEALGKFLEQHVKAIVMEVKIEGENLIVTTTPEAQRGVGQFIALIEGKSPQGQVIRRSDVERWQKRPQAK